MTKDIENLNKLFGIEQTDPKKPAKKVNKDIQNLNNLFGITEEESENLTKKSNNIFDNAKKDLSLDLTNRDYISEYDDPYNTDMGMTDLNELRANRQSGVTKGLTGVGRIATKVVAEVAKMPGMIVGGLAAPFAEEGEGWETFVNNSWIKSINEANEYINEDILPVYVKKAVQEGNLWDNISSVDFWATEGADGIGYIVSMMVPGTALKGLGAGKYLSQVKGLKGLISAQKADVVTATIANTLFEAGAEAGNAMENFQKDMDAKLSSGEITQEEYEQLKLQKATLGRDIFLANSLILLGPNALQANMLWGKGVNRTASKLLDNEGKLLKSVVNPSTYQKIVNRGKNILGATVSEGFWEEGMQSTVEKMFSESAEKGELTSNFFKNFNGNELGNAYLDTITSTDGQKAMFLGAFLGGGMSAYHGAKSDIANRKTTQSLLDVGNTAIDAFYKTMQTDLYNEDGSINVERVKEKFESFGQIEQLNLMYNEAVQKQDKEALEKLRDLAATQLAYGFIMNEDLGLQVLEEHLKASSQFDEIVQREQDAGNKISKQEIIENVMSKAKVLEKAYTNFNDFAPSLINPELKENQSEEDVQNFTNTLRGNYLSNKANIDLNEKTLAKLKKQRQAVLEDLGLSSELVIGDETISEQEQSDERLKKVTEDIQEVETNLNRLKKLDKGFWNKEHLQKSFNRFTKEKKQLEKETSPEVLQNTEDIITKINSLETLQELKDYWGSLDESHKANVAISDIVSDKSKELIEKEKLQKELKEVETVEKDTETFQEDADFGTNTETTTTTKAVDKPIINDLETIQSSENPEVDKDGNQFDKSPLSVVNLKENTNPEHSDKNQGAARLISTYKDTGEPIPGLEAFVEYEKTPRDKTKDKVTFSLGDITAQKQDKELKSILDKLKQGEKLSDKEITALENYLPIKVTLSNGKNSASSFLDAMSHRNPEIVARETLPLRKAIIKALIDNEGDFKGIEGKVEKQFTGTLQLGEQNNNILELDVFKGMSEQEKINYFKKNTVYVSNKGVIKYTATDAIDNTKSLKSSNRGEVFLKIPMINGEMFYLKLNTNRLSDEKAEATFELIKLFSNVSNKKQELSSGELEEFINTNLPALKTEFDFIKRNEDDINITLEKLINFIVFSQNTNAKTRLEVKPNGTLLLGELLHKFNEKLPEFDDKIKHYYYTNEILNSLSGVQRQSIIDYLKYKRHNVLITKDNVATFNNEDYIKYLLGINSDYPILSTNAVVNEPTFQGYSNIYLNQGITNKAEKKVKPAEETKEIPLDNPEDLLSSLEGMYGDDIVTTPVQPKATDNVVEVKQVKSNNLKDIFNQADSKMKAKITMVIAKQLDMVDKINPKNIEESFDKLYENLKDNESLQNEIKKICGI